LVLIRVELLLLRLPLLRCDRLRCMSFSPVRDEMCMLMLALKVTDRIQLARRRERVPWRACRD
jgi:hypothetical protein